MLSFEWCSLCIFCFKKSIRVLYCLKIIFLHCRIFAVRCSGYVLNNLKLEQENPLVDYPPYHAKSHLRESQYPVRSTRRWRTFFRGSQIILTSWEMLTAPGVRGALMLFVFSRIVVTVKAWDTLRQTHVRLGKRGTPASLGFMRWEVSIFVFTSLSFELEIFGMHAYSRMWFGYNREIMTSLSYSWRPNIKCS